METTQIGCGSNYDAFHDDCVRWGGSGTSETVHPSGRSGFATHYSGYCHGARAPASQRLADLKSCEGRGPDALIRYRRWPSTGYRLKEATQLFPVPFILPE